MTLGQSLVQENERVSQITWNTKLRRQAVCTALMTKCTVEGVAAATKVFVVIEFISLAR